MKPFIEYLKDHPWIPQVIQHTLSLHASVPIRILDKSLIFKNKLTYDELLMKRVIGIQPELSIIPKQVITYFSNRNNSAWFTRPSNMHPLIRELRRDKRWVAWEHYFIYDWLRNETSQNVAPVRYFAEGMKIVAGKILIEGVFDGYVIVGPVFSPPGDNSDETFAKLIVNQYLESVFNALPDITSKLGFDKNGLQQIGGTNGWMGESRLMHRVAYLQKVFTCLFSMQYNERYPLQLQRCTVNSIAQLAFLRSKNEMLESIDKMNKLTGGIPLCFELNQRPSPVSPMTEAENKKLVVRLNENKWELCYEKNLGGRKVWLTNLQDGTFLGNKRFQENLDCLSNMRREIELSYGNLHYGYANDSLTRFWTLLNKDFGLVPGVLKNGDDDNSDSVISDMYRRIARELTILFTADMCTIHVYDYKKKVLEPKIVYLQGKYEKHEYDRLNDLICTNIKKAAEDDILKNHSLVFRCFENKEPRFCRAWWPAQNLADPPEDPILNPSSEPGLFRSSFAVPLLVSGRIFGVLELAGKRVYQFRYANVSFAMNIAEALGNFLYHKEVLGGIARLAQNALDADMDDDKKYNQIPQEFTNLLLAEASALYVPGLTGRNEYVLKAWHNRKDLDDIKRDSPDKIPSLSHTIKDSPFFSSVNSDNVYVQFKISDLIKKYPKWVDSLPQRSFIVDQYAWMAVVPIKSPDQPDQILGGLVLYYENLSSEEALKPPLEKWKPTIEFMSHYVALLMASIKTRQAKEERTQNILRHEVKYVVNTLSKRAGAMIDDIPSLEIPANLGAKEITDYFNTVFRRKFGDIISYKNMLNEFGELLKKETLKDLMKSNLSPALYLIKRRNRSDFSIKSAQLSIRRILIDIFKPLEGEMEKKWINHRYKIPAHGPYVFLDKLRLHRIFENLYGNAIKYSLADTWIALNVVEHKRMVEVHLENIGEVLTDKNEENLIFEDNFRGSNSGLQDGEGLGLGIARIFAESLRGSISLKTKKNG